MQTYFYIEITYYENIFMRTVKQVRGMGGMGRMRSYLDKKKFLFCSRLRIYLIVLFLYGF